MNVIRIEIVLIVLFFLSCHQNESYNSTLVDIEKLLLKPDKETYALGLHIRAKTTCPVPLTILMDGKNYSSPIILNGVIDTLFRSDWYQNELSFMVDEEDCIVRSDVRISLYK